jgi:hypothetical protein
LGKNSQHENPSKRYRHTVALCATISAQSPAVGFSEAFVGFSTCEPAVRRSFAAVKPETHRDDG